MYTHNDKELWKNIDIILTSILPLLNKKHPVSIISISLGTLTAVIKNEKRNNNSYFLHNRNYARDMQLLKMKRSFHLRGIIISIGNEVMKMTIKPKYQSKDNTRPVNDTSQKWWREMNEFKCRLNAIRNWINMNELKVHLHRWMPVNGFVILPGLKECTLREKGIVSTANVKSKTIELDDCFVSWI